MTDPAYRAQLVRLAGLAVDNPNLSIADLEELADEGIIDQALRRAIGTGVGTGGGGGGGGGGTGTGGVYTATYSATY